MLKYYSDISPALRSFLGTVLFLTALGAPGVYFLYDQAAGSIVKSLKLNESIHNRMVAQSIALDLKTLFMDLYPVANHAETTYFLRDRTERSRHDLVGELMALSTASGAYDQIRILGNDGMELIRINYNNGHPAPVPPDKLQNKANRYYFKESLALENGEIYISPFDLNIENKQIEVPLKPMIRVSTPVYDDTGRRLGIVILNYLGQRIIDRPANGHFKEGPAMLLNQNGYWLASPHPEKNWAFMFKGRKDQSFKTEHPETWALIKAMDQGQFSTPRGLYTVSTIRVTPKEATGVKVARSREWKVVCFTSAAALHAQVAPVRLRYLTIFGTIFLLSVLIGLTRARFTAARERGRRELEAARRAAEEANRAKSDFLARMSHEIRTPMNAIIGLTHLALKTELTAKQSDYLSKVSLSANSLLGIINDILDFSKIEAGRLTVDEADFLLDDVLNNIINMLGPAAEQKGIEFLLMVRSTVPNRLRGDALRLGQVLLNLTNNAIKFTEKGEVILKAVLLEQDGTKAVIRFSVRDTGVGIGREHMDRLFQPFSQADGSITRRFGGTGLGLSISKRLVEMMGGEMTVTSEPGKGSEFSFSIPPLKLQPAHADDTFEYPAEIKGLRVLVVDDSRMSRMVLCKVLESFTFKVEEASCAADAPALLEERDGTDPFRLVITDWNMPDTDGIQLALRIRKSPAFAHKPKIIMLTAYGQESIRHRAREVGIDGYMLKPFNRSILFDTIMDTLSGSPERRSRVSARADRTGVPSNLRGARILLAEDNEINQQVAREILESADITVSIANNGQEALNMALSQDFDAVLMDIQMPVMDGFKAVRGIRSGGKTSLPIIAMTAHAPVGDREKSLEAGMNDHVTKPIDPEELMKTLAHWLPDRDGQAPPPPEAAPRSAGDGAMPALPGVDTDQALARLRGNDRLYRKLLRDFAQDGEMLLQKLAADASAERFEACRGVTHNLKGAAGNIGADRMHETPSRLEQALLGGQGDLHTRLDEAVRESRRVIAGINEAFPPEREAEIRDADRNMVREKEIRDMLPELETLLGLLQRHDIDAQKAFRPLREALAEMAPAQAREMARLIDQFDFTTAGETLRELMERCRDDGGPDETPAPGK